MREWTCFLLISVYLGGENVFLFGTVTVANYVFSVFCVCAFLLIILRKTYLSSGWNSIDFFL